MRILYLVPDMYGAPGGIARHSQYVRRALQGTGIEVSVIVLHDRRGSVDQDVDRGAGYHPCDGSRARFVVKTLLGLLERPSLVIVGHVHLLPVVLFPARALRIP